MNRQFSRLTKCGCLTIGRYKNNEKSVAGWVEYAQNATLVFMSAYSIYVFLGKITIPLSTRLYQQRYLFWLRRLDLNQRPSGLSHKALPCLPLENIVALLAWSASQFSLFSHLSTTPVSATGGGVPLRPNERSSSRHNPERKKEQVS